MQRRALLLVVLTTAVVALCFGVALAKRDHDAHERQTTWRLLARTEERSMRLGAYMTRMRAVLDTIAAGGSIRRLVDGTGTGHDVDDTRVELLHVDRVFPGAIGGAALLLPDGRRLLETVAGRPVLARRTRTEAAPEGALQSAPYRSALAAADVIAFRAPVLGADGDAGVLEVELTLRALGTELAADRTNADLSIVDRRTGQVVVTAAGSQLGDHLRPADEGSFRALRRTRAGVGIESLGGGRVAAYRTLQVAGPSNDWLLVAAGEKGSVVAGVSRGVLALVLVSLLAIIATLAVLSISRRRLERLALDDGLTGLANRRRLERDLARRIRAATPAAPVAVLLFDLDGFKLYNDTFGHPAGDALLARMGARLAAATARYGTAYRLGGDEFCLLVDKHLAAEAIPPVCAALHEQGIGFEVTTSWGQASIPDEADSASAALALADKRLYLHKAGGRSSTGRQITDVLRELIQARDPTLDSHADAVAALAERVAAQLGLEGEALIHLRRAAQLHDIGKLAIPEAILSKPGPLDSEEWAFVRRQPEVGDRILAAAPTLAPVAAVLRDSREHWDGTGYPRGLQGEQIPLGARIIAVCDAFDAIVTDRPYRRARCASAALVELRRCAGTQFDPAVVAALEAAVAEPAEADRQAA